MSSGLRHGPSRSMMLVMVTSPMVSCFMLFPSRGEATAAAVVFAPLPLRERAAPTVQQSGLGEGWGATPHPRSLSNIWSCPLPQGERAQLQPPRLHYAAAAATGFSLVPVSGIRAAALNPAYTL